MADEDLPTKTLVGEALDRAAREAGGWPDDVIAFSVEVIGHGDDPQVMLEGSTAHWMPRAKRWTTTGHKPVLRAVIPLSTYRAALTKRSPQ